jgi:cyclase
MHTGTFLLVAISRSILWDIGVHCQGNRPADLFRGSDVFIEAVTGLRASDIFMPGNGIFSGRQRPMSQEPFLKAVTRREMLRAASLLGGGSALAGLLPRTLLAEAQAAAAGKAQNPSPAPADPVEQMKQQKSSVPLETMKLRDNIQMLSGPGGNRVVLDGQDGKILVDSSFAAVAPKVKQALDGISSTPFKMLIHTHWHFDHTDGNAAMRQFGATILAHENTRKRLSTAPFMKFHGMHVPPSPAEALPHEMFTDNFKLYWNKEEISLAQFSPAHTDTDIYVRYQSANVLHMGDTWFNGMYPFFDSSTGGKINGMITAATQGIALTDDSTKIVPGPGPAGDKASLTKYRDMLVTVRDRIKTQKDSGKALKEVIAAKPTADFDRAWGVGFLMPDAFVTLVYTTL